MKNLQIRANHRGGLTLVELLVVVTILGLLAALLIPAVQSVRETSRRVDCANRLTNIGRAMHSYHASHQRFPPLHNSHSPFIYILPHLGEENFFDKYVDLSRHVTDLPDPPVPPIFHCPSDPYTTHWLCDYQINDGLEFDLRRTGFLVDHRSGPRYLSISDFRDGLANTAMVSESAVNFGSAPDWTKIISGVVSQPNVEDFAAACQARDPSAQRGSGSTNGQLWYHYYGPRYNHVLPPNHNSCSYRGISHTGAFTATSYHGGGVNVVFMDGRLEFVSRSIDVTVWRAAGTRAGGEAVAWGQ